MHNCLLCHSSEVKTLFTIEKTRVCQCHTCQVVFLFPQPTNLELKNFYASYLEKYPNRYESEALQENSPSTNRIKTILHRIKPPAKLLDVGCATGNFLIAARDAGYSANGVEINRKSASIAQKTTGLKIHKQPLEKLSLEPGSFDVITLWDVLEHLKSPEKAITLCYKLLKPGGVLALSTVNWTAINRKIFQKKWRYLIPVEHLYYFNPTMLKLYLRECGFEVLSSKTIFSPHAFLEGVSKTSGAKNISLNRLSKRSFKLALTTKDLLAKIISWPISRTPWGDIIEMYLQKENTVLSWGKFWDRMAKNSSRLNQVNRDKKSIASDVKNIMGRLKISKRDIVLDFCSGNGIVTHEIAPNCQQIVGIDISNELIKRARIKLKHPKTKVSFRTGDLHLLKRYNNFFTKIYCLTSFHYFPSEDYAHEVINIMLTALKPHGQILLTDIPSKTSLWYLVWRLIRNPNKYLPYEQTKMHPSIPLWLELIERLKLVFRRFSNLKVESDDWFWYNPAFFEKLKIKGIKNIKIFPSATKRKLRYRFDVMIST